MNLGNILSRNWLLYRVGQLAARLKTGNLTGGNLNGGTGLRIATLPGGPFADREGAETHQSYLITFGQRLGDSIKKCRKGPLGGCLADTSGVSHAFNQFTFVHARFPPVIFYRVFGLGSITVKLSNRFKQPTFDCQTKKLSYSNPKATTSTS
jgi:hypothetical protein